MMDDEQERESPLERHVAFTSDALLVKAVLRQPVVIIANGNPGYDKLRVGNFRHRAPRLLSGFRRSARPRSRGWPRLWDLLQYCLSRKAREQIYEPAYNELLEDYLESRKYRTKWARRWVYFAFTLRTLLLMADCWREVFKDKLSGLVPEWIRKWWTVRPRI
jgi:hypothetical protein